MDVSAQQRVVAVGASAGEVKALIRRAAALPSFAPKSLPANDIDSTDVVLKLTTADESGRYRSLVLLLGVGGLRWGEAAAQRVGRCQLFTPTHRVAPQRRAGGHEGRYRHAEVE